MMMITFLTLGRKAPGVRALGPTPLESPFDADVTWSTKKHSFCAIDDLLAVLGPKNRHPRVYRPKWEKTWPRCGWTTMQNFKPIGKAPAEKSVSIQKRKWQRQSRLSFPPILSYVWINTYYSSEHVVCVCCVLGVSSVCGDPWWRS